jgi:hypothetical protein
MNQQGQTQHRYRALDASKEEIRLLTYKSDQLHLEHFALDKAPAYRALSYPWGPEAPFFIINIDHTAFRVRNNLHDFLGSFVMR